jgi:hypothetical protein
MPADRISVMKLGLSFFSEVPKDYCSSKGCETCSYLLLRVVNQSVE